MFVQKTKNCVKVTLLNWFSVIKPLGRMSSWPLGKRVLVSRIALSSRCLCPTVKVLPTRCNWWCPISTDFFVKFFWFIWNQFFFNFCYGFECVIFPNPVWVWFSRFYLAPMLWMFTCFLFIFCTIPNAFALLSAEWLFSISWIPVLHIYFHFNLHFLSMLRFYLILCQNLA